MTESSVQVEVTIRGPAEKDARGYESRANLANIEIETDWSTAVAVYRSAVEKLTSNRMEVVTKDPDD
jgi:hypothetical protein